MAAVHNVVIIGASFAGIPLAHALLKEVLPAAAATSKQVYKVILISPSEYFYFKVAGPRVLVNPTSLPTEKALLPIADGFKSYKPEQYEFIKAYVSAIEPESKTLKLSTGASVSYGSLVIASGTSFATDLWSVTNGEDKLQAALQDMHSRIPSATTILVGGGGAVGVETTGELADVYGGKKEITILSGAGSLLPKLQNKKVGVSAEANLKKMGVQVVHNVKVSGATQEGGKTVLQLSDGTTKAVDVYIECTGDRPNSSFVPAAWLNERKLVKTDNNTLRLDVPGVTGVYGFGSVASFSSGSLFDTKFGIGAIKESIKLDLEGKAPGPRTKNVYKKIQSDMQIVPIGHTGGVGVLFGYKVPSFMVKVIKAKDFMIGNAAKVIDGTG